MGRGFILVLEGEISVGKSTLGRSLQDRGHFLGLPVIFMKEYDNPMLPLYLEDQENYAFSFQIVALRERFNTHREAERLAAEGNCVVIDRGVAGDIGFALLQKARGFFSAKEWPVYWTTVLEHRDTRFKPDMVVYLECSPEQAFERLKTRGNQDEINSYTLEYFQQLKASHEEAFKLYGEVTGMKSPSMRIDWSRSESIQSGRTSPAKLNVSADGVLPESSLEKFEKIVMSWTCRLKPTSGLLTQLTAKDELIVSTDVATKQMLVDVPSSVEPGICVGCIGTGDFDNGTSSAGTSSVQKGGKG